MKLLVVLEHRFFALPNDELVYCERNVDYSFFKRYLNVFEEVTVCARTVDVGSDFEGKLIASGERVSFLKLPNSRGAKEIMKKAPSYRKILKENLDKCDAVLLRAPSAMSLLTLDVVKKSGKPFAAEFVVDPQIQDSEDKSFASEIIKKVMVRHAKKLCMEANGVSYVTDYVLQKDYPCRAITDGESKKYFTAGYSTIDIRAEQYSGLHPFHTGEEPVVVVLTGYMDGNRKGHTIAIDVVKRCVDQGLNLVLKFIGTGPLEQTFREYAKKCGMEDRVLFMGQIYGYENLQKELINSDIFIFPTSSEGLPRSLIEAMANGLACISSPVAGIKEMLPEQYLVEREDVERMAEILKRLVCDVEERESAAKANYQTSLKYEYHNLEKIRTEYYTKLYRLAQTMR
jgi:glycosyltransferase involved in cell wall biosynthesis